MGPSQNIEIFQESRLKHILRIQWLKLPTHFDLFTPFTLYTFALQTGRRIHVAGQHGSGPQDAQNVPPEGIT